MTAITFPERPVMWAHIENHHGADYEVCDHPVCRAAYVAEVLESVTDEQVRELLKVQEKRVAELEALLNAEQAAAEAAGDDIQAALPGYPPPAGHGLGRWRAGMG